MKPVERHAPVDCVAARRVRSAPAACAGRSTASPVLDAELPTKPVGCRRLRVVYRLVGGVLLMGVVRRGACVLRLLRLLDAATRLLVAAARTVDVTPDKLARRYPEARHRKLTSLSQRAAASYPRLVCAWTWLSRSFACHAASLSFTCVVSPMQRRNFV